MKVKVEAVTMAGAVSGRMICTSVLKLLAPVGA